MGDRSFQTAVHPKSLFRGIQILCVLVALVGLFVLPKVRFELSWLLAFCLCFAALEFFPVEIPSERLLLAFSLPAICGIWAVSGAWNILICPLIAGLVHLRRWNALPTEYRSAGVKRIVVMMGVLPIASSAADFAAAASYNNNLQWPIATLTFVIAAISTALLVWLGMDGAQSYRLAHRMLSDAMWDWVIIFTVLVIASIACVAVFHHRLLALLPLAMISLIALRMAYARRSKAAFHRIDSFQLLTKMMQSAHPYTHGHIERVGRMAEDVALKMGLNPAEARLVREAAILHDIGKIAIDEEILDFQGPLTDEQLEHVRQHAVVSGHILESNPDFRDVAHWVRHHHERPDGSGYPDALRDYEIEMPSKIIAVADAYDAMVGGGHPNQKRPYRNSLTTEEALEELERCSGTQFDPQVVAAFRTTIFGTPVNA